MSGLSNLTNSFNLKASGRGLTVPTGSILDLQGRDGGVLVVSTDGAKTIQLPKAPVGTIVYIISQQSDVVRVVDVAGTNVQRAAGHSLDLDIDTREVGIFICSNSDGTWAGVLAKGTTLT